MILHFLALSLLMVLANLALQMQLLKELSIALIQGLQGSKCGKTLEWYLRTQLTGI